MLYDKEKLLTLPLNERKELASELIDSILADETKPLPDWKKELINERIKYHNENPGNGVEWNELKKRFGR
jgi:putative addiction module component (TIGR02574 family)